MARLGTTAGNQALNGLDASGTPSNQIGFVALHVGDPSTTGANENANAGSYARQACSWNAASGLSKTNSSSLSFSTLGTIAVPYFAGWSSGTYAGGNYGIGGALGASVTAPTITIAPGALTIGAS